MPAALFLSKIIQVFAFQDSSVVVVKHRADVPGVLRSVFAVCDGHGMLGQQAAEITVT